MSSEARPLWRVNSNNLVQAENQKPSTPPAFQTDSDNGNNGFIDEAAYSNPGSDLAPLSDFNDDDEARFSSPRAPLTPDMLSPIGSDTFPEDGEYSFEPPPFDGYDGSSEEGLPGFQNGSGMMETERKVEGWNGMWDHVGLLRENGEKRCHGCQEFVSAMFNTASLSTTDGETTVDLQAADVQICIHDSWGELIECAKSSCGLCLFIKVEIENRLIQQDSKRDLQEEDFGDKPVMGRITFHRVSNEVDAVDFWVGEGPNSAESENSMLQSWYQRTLSVSVQQLDETIFVEGVSNKIEERIRLQEQDRREFQYKAAREWIKVCTANHERCRDRQSESTKFLPKRFLEVGTNEEPVLKLVNSSDLKSESHFYATRSVGVEYAILSYCWGKGGHAFGTTLQNLKERYVSLDEETFPQTWRDAVAIARGLGLRYLWIDALCIIQSGPGEDRSDWESQFPFMGLVYRNSVCAIAASGASSCHVGCFPKSHPKVSPIFGYHITNPDTNTALDQKHSTSYILEPKFPLYQSYVQSSPLNTRAWVFQERTLSQRTLYYTKAGLFWECCEKVYSEHERPDASSIDTNQTAIQPNGLKQLIAFATETAPSSTSMTRTTWTGQKEIFDTRMEITEQQWLYAMQEYSERNMTFSSDKLPAIAGIAERIASITNEEYLAGIWRKSLLLQSAWLPYTTSSTSSTKTKEIKRIPGIPTWSWASIEGPIRFEHTDQQEQTHPAFDLLDIIRPNSLSSSDLQKSKFADSPHLLLRAPVSKLRIRRSPPSFPRTLQYHNAETIYFEPFLSAHQPENEDEDGEVGFDRDTNYLRPDTMSDLTLFDTGEVELLKWMSWDVIRRSFGGGRELTWKWVCAIVVAPAESEAGNDSSGVEVERERGDLRNVKKYKRIGWAHFDLACPLLRDLFGTEGEERRDVVLLV